MARSRGGKDILSIPALSVRDGLPVVVGKGGKYDHLQDERGETITPREFVDELVKRYGDILYLIDINGIENNRPQYDLIRDLAKAASVYVDAGSPNPDSLMDIFIAGAEMAVLSTKACIDMDDIRRVVEVSDNVILCIDYNKGVLSPNEQIASMSPASIASKAAMEGIRSLVFADYGRKRRHPLDRDMIKELVRTEIDIFVGGMIMEADLGPLMEMGARGALLDLRAIIRDW